MQRHVFPNIEELSQAFADFAETTLQNTLAHKPQATLVVPGGNTPRYYLPALAKCKLPWDRITVTLSDERWVDVTDEQSNEHLVKQHLMSHLPADTRFVGLKTRHDNPFAAVEEIHQRLDKLPLPLSLTVLGLGEDGHIASLFPGMNPDLTDTRNCVAVAPPIAPSQRISLSLNILANSENIALVVLGKAKRRLLDQLNEYPDPKLPIVWLLQLSDTAITVFETGEV
ncbi:MAG: 6-phosphogluconolactonase [Nitrosomonas sp.]|uniref:6-phosphogluconolactonase n=1 Tax=Pseudomonadati TaxID=3379134 RepID=UPI002725145F|nr:MULTISPECIES: 6-phosphogluconolactonase [Bacteria]MDO8997479.1 6-phosphogluconolactonase [Sediminibacterium sp.]MDP3664654.1 6-phosphogluconolactonase [Nitrosomonas sp.]MDZ4106135.1 6-phosphogluconolactonase [Nitrosomonas sp.]